MAEARLLNSFRPSLLHRRSICLQLWHGLLLSHLTRFRRHQSQARCTWLLLGRGAGTAAPFWADSRGETPTKVVNMAAAGERRSEESG